MHITREDSPSEETLAIIRAAMRRHTESAGLPWQAYADLAHLARDDAGALLGAALGEAGRNYLHVSVIWVHESHRRQGLGSQLLHALEHDARTAHRCQHAYLDTFSYQARPFYENHGYRVFGTLDDYPPGHQRFFMHKLLPPR